MRATRAATSGRGTTSAPPPDSAEVAEAVVNDAPRAEMSSPDGETQAAERDAPEVGLQRQPAQDQRQGMPATQLHVAVGPEQRHSRAAHLTRWRRWSNGTEQRSGKVKGGLRLTGVASSGHLSPSMEFGTANGVPKRAAGAKKSAGPRQLTALQDLTAEEKPPARR